MSLPEETLTRLKQFGYKITPQRVAVLRAINNTREHLTPVALYQKVRREQPGIGLVTVYRTLNILGELGLVCEVVRDGNNSRSYVVSPLQHHGHLICSECSTVVDFTGCNLDDLEHRLSHETGFAIESHRLEFYGYCRDCQKIVSM